MAAQGLAGICALRGHAAQRERLLVIGAEMAVHRYELAIHLVPQGLLAVLTGKWRTDACADSYGDAGRNSRITLPEPVALRRAGREMALLVGSTIAADRLDP